MQGDEPFKQVPGDGLGHFFFRGLRLAAIHQILPKPQAPARLVQRHCAR